MHPSHQIRFSKKSTPIVFLYSEVKMPRQYFWIIEDFPTAPLPTMTTCRIQALVFWSVLIGGGGSLKKPFSRYSSRTARKYLPPVGWFCFDVQAQNKQSKVWKEFVCFHPTGRQSQNILFYVKLRTISEEDPYNLHDKFAFSFAWFWDKKVNISEQAGRHNCNLLLLKFKGLLMYLTFITQRYSHQH